MPTSEGLIEDFAQICTAMSCLISGLMILGHLCYYNERNLQKYIIRILFMVPIYSLATLYSILNPESLLYCGAIRDFYEAYVLYTFMQLLIQYMGGDSSLQIHLEFKVSFAIKSLPLPIAAEEDTAAMAS